MFAAREVSTGDPCVPVVLGVLAFPDGQLVPCRAVAAEHAKVRQTSAVGRTRALCCHEGGSGVGHHSGQAPKTSRRTETVRPGRTRDVGNCSSSVAGTPAAYRKPSCFEMAACRSYTCRMKRSSTWCGRLTRSAADSVTWNSGGGMIVR